LVEASSANAGRTVVWIKGLRKSSWRADAAAAAAAAAAIAASASTSPLIDGARRTMRLLMMATLRSEEEAAAYGAEPSRGLKVTAPPLGARRMAAPADSCGIILIGEMVAPALGVRERAAPGAVSNCGLITILDETTAPVLGVRERVGLAVSSGFDLDELSAP